MRTITNLYRLLTCLTMLFVAAFTTPDAKAGYYEFVIPVEHCSGDATPIKGLDAKDIKSISIRLYDKDGPFSAIAGGAYCQIFYNDKNVVIDKCSYKKDHMDKEESPLGLYEGLKWGTLLHCGDTKLFIYDEIVASNLLDPLGISSLYGDAKTITLHYCEIIIDENISTYKIKIDEVRPSCKDISLNALTESFCQLGAQLNVLSEVK